MAPLAPLAVVDDKLMNGVLDDGDFMETNDLDKVCIVSLMMVIMCRNWNSIFFYMNEMFIKLPDFWDICSHC